MVQDPSRDLAVVLSSRSGDIAERWQQALALTGFVAASVPEVRATLTSLVERAVRVLLAEPADRDEGRAIGAAIAELHYVHPDALERTEELLAQELLDDLRPTERRLLQPRLGPLLAALSAGFVTKARAITLAEQDAIRNAILAERDRANDELRAVLNAAVDAMVLISPERRALMINRRFTEIFDIPAERIVGRSFEELRPVVEPLYANPEVLGRLITRVASSAEEAADDLIQVRPRARILQLRSVPVQRADGALLGRLHIFRDVTRERELDRREREFMVGATHELRTPLTAIKGYVDLLLAEQVDPTEQRDFFRIIQHNANRMRTLVNDLIDLSSLELGQLSLCPDWVSLPTLLEHTASALRPQIRAKGQQLVVEMPHTLPAVWGDAERLAQVFTNLLVNAHHYTPEGGRIALQAVDEPGVVRVSVVDTGVGMSAEEQVHLFTKFYRVRNRHTRSVRGTGLGLAISRSLVELHGGTITVQSAPGAGSTFVVTLPTQPPESGRGP